MKSTFLLVLSILLFSSGSVFAQSKLTKSVKVSNFVLTDAVGGKVNLQALLKNNDRVLICFFRPVWCPICNKRTHELIERYDELKAKGIEVIAVYPNKPDVMAQYVKDASIPFPVIGDPDESLYQQFSIERSLKKIQKTMGREDFQTVLSSGMELYRGKQYEQSTDAYETIINADFLLTDRRQVEVAYYGDYVGDHYDLDNL